MPAAEKRRLTEGISEVEEESPYMCGGPAIRDLRRGVDTLASEHCTYGIHVRLSYTPAALTIPRVMSSLRCPRT